ncbi:hypothetical protein BDV34DRAFT_7351 [Aspergillus parasiticus]|uniref:Uncharacterized protein n=1 Tax=Aspergillus parasiticus TaxID=5067 RepID=A0A5N6DYW6_ASPPA|nr:hypothetical protein BDV34DRAFT_7351 [Aspergillus parasiticus]
MVAKIQDSRKAIVVSKRSRLRENHTLRCLSSLQSHECLAAVRAQKNIGNNECLILRINSSPMTASSGNNIFITFAFYSWPRCLFYLFFDICKTLLDGRV